jgi:hypothetical protein
MRVIGGRYGLSSKEFTSAMVKAIYNHLTTENLQRHFTIGIQDNVTHTSLDFDPSFSTESESVVRAIFYGLGAVGSTISYRDLISTKSLCDREKVRIVDLTSVMADCLLPDNLDVVGSETTARHPHRC